MAKGIDIYKYQTVNNWQAVENSGVTFVYVKHTDGGRQATVPADNQVNGAKSVGLPVGGYHYAQFNPIPEVQADLLINEIERTHATDLVPMLDLEAPFVANQAAIDFGVRFCRRVVARGYRPGVYMNNAFAKILRPDLWDTNPVVWIARYGAKPDPAAGHYDIHQYAPDGSVQGISGEVDLDESYTDAHIIRRNVITQSKEVEMGVQAFEYQPTPSNLDAKGNRIPVCHTFVCPSGRASAIVQRAWISIKSANGPMKSARLMAIASGRPDNQTWVIDKTWENVRSDRDRPWIEVGGDKADDPLAYVDQFTAFVVSDFPYSITLETLPR